MSEKQKFKPGQELWKPKTGRNPGRLVKIEKVGRDYLYMENRDRVKIATLSVDNGHGYYTGERYYLSEQAWALATRAQAAWDKFREAVYLDHKIKPGVEAEAIISAAKLLGLDLKLPEEPKP